MIHVRMLHNTSCNKSDVNQASWYRQVRVTMHKYMWWTCILAGASSLLDHATQNAVTLTQCSFWPWLVRVSRQFVCVPVLQGSFVKLCLCKESCTSTVDSTGIIWLPFAARRRTNQLSRTSHICQLPCHWLVLRPPQTLQDNRQTENHKVTIEPAHVLCVPDGKTTDLNTHIRQRKTRNTTASGMTELQRACVSGLPSRLL